MNKPHGLLDPVQRLATSGARALAVFELEGRLHLAVPQLAEDIAGEAPYMNGGNSDLSMPIFRWEDGAFREYQSLPVSGGEDAEFFRIGARAFLATASLRSGRGAYEYNVPSVLYEWNGTGFEPFQSFSTFAAKQWKFFSIGDRHFLALAQGVAMPGLEPAQPSPSTIFEWDGVRFLPFQTVASAWGYNWLHFRIGEQDFLAYADHHEPSAILRWNGTAFEPFQTLDGKSGRAFAYFEGGGAHYLAFANLLGDSLLYRWTGKDFAIHQTLSGPGGREFATFQHDGAVHLVQANFLTGTPKNPETALDSAVFRLADTGMERVEAFRTFGATDVAVFQAGSGSYLAVAESLSAEVRFRTDSRIYRIHP